MSKRMGILKSIKARDANSYPLPNGSPMAVCLEALYAIGVTGVDAKGQPVVAFTNVTEEDSPLDIRIRCNTRVRFAHDKSDGCDWEFAHTDSVTLAQQASTQWYQNLAATTAGVGSNARCQEVQFEAGWRSPAAAEANKTYSDKYNLSLILYTVLPGGTYTVPYTCYIDPDIQNPGSDGLPPGRGG